MNTQRPIKNLTRDVLPIAPDALAKRISIDAGGLWYGLSRRYRYSEGLSHWFCFWLSCSTTPFGAGATSP
jgi:hypothetical protein